MIIVLGASRGIGFELVQTVIEEGQECIALSRNLDRLEKLTSPLLKPYALDATAYEAVSNWFSGDIEWEKVTGVVYCLGKLVNKPFSKLSTQDWESVYATNVFGPAFFARHIVNKCSQP
ncbi:MAG: SDR family NAD(P)-dependent oxidoreductase, partial [Luteibaculum sp.]